MKILVLNGPNINFLGIREKEIYGTETYETMCNYILNTFEDSDVEIDILQSNIEGELINFLQKAYFEKYDGIVINPGAYTHTSIALFDAIKSINIPTIEVHLSNIHQREEFRHKSFTAPACLGQICGLGKEGYIFAIEALIIHINNKRKN